MTFGAGRRKPDQAELNPNSKVGERARLGRGWTRLASSLLRVRPSTAFGSHFGPQWFSARTRKTAPETGALPISSLEFGLSWPNIVSFEFAFKLALIENELLTEDREVETWKQAHPTAPLLPRLKAQARH